MSHEKHIAIILVNNYMPERLLVYGLNIPKLIKHFKKKEWPYKIYFKVDKEKFKQIVNNPKATHLYIVGHGQRHGVKVSHKEIIYYCDFADSSKKDFIAQLHCNHYGGKSLVEYISKNPSASFATDKKLINFQLNKFIEKVIKGNVHRRPER